MARSEEDCGCELRRPRSSPQTRTLRIAEGSVRSMLGALAGGWEAASTRAVTTASKPTLSLQASSGMRPRTKGCHSGAGATGATSPRRYLCRSVIVLATARAPHSATSASRTNARTPASMPVYFTGRTPLREGAPLGRRGCPGPPQPDLPSRDPGRPVGSPEGA